MNYQSLHNEIMISYLSFMKFNLKLNENDVLLVLGGNQIHRIADFENDRFGKTYCVS